jgi:hypothetical protein
MLTQAVGSVLLNAFGRFKFGEGYDRVRGLLVVTDNNESAASSFKEVRKCLLEARLPAPDRLEVCSRDTKSGMGVVVLTWPRSDTQGSLETMCLEAMRRCSPNIAECVDTFSVCTGVDKWRKSKRQKALVRFMISAQCEKDPNTSLVYVWSGGRPEIIPVSDPAFDSVAEFLSDFDRLLIE